MAKSVSYSSALKREYEERFAHMQIRPEYAVQVDAVVDRIERHMDEYRAVEQATGVPATVVGIIHIREASGRFDRHLHNGDPLTARTVQVPAGRPPKGSPPFRWADSAEDALTMPGHALHKWDDWSVGGIAYVLERYNGFGYRLYHSTVPSPYLWGCTTEYSCGMYVADGQWDDNAVNRNPGGMAMLKRIMERGLPGAAAAEPATPPADDLADVETAIAALESAAVPAQLALKKHGFYDGDVDGLFGPDSWTAFLAYRRLHRKR